MVADSSVLLAIRIHSFTCVVILLLQTHSLLPKSNAFAQTTTGCRARRVSTALLQGVFAIQPLALVVVPTQRLAALEPHLSAARLVLVWIVMRTGMQHRIAFSQWDVFANRSSIGRYTTIRLA